MFYTNSARFVLGLCLVLGAKGSLVDHIDPCHINDNDCVLKSSKKFMPILVQGDSEHGIPSMEPMKMDKIDASSNELQLVITNIVLTGLSKCKITSVKRPEDLKVYLALECPLSANGQYKTSGKLLGLDISGDDNFKMTADNMKISVDASLTNFEGKDGKTYLKIAKFNYEYDPGTKSYLDFENVCKDDKEKAILINEIMHNNAKDVLNGPGKPVITGIITEIVHCINKALAVMPKDKLQLV